MCNTIISYIYKIHYAYNVYDVKVMIMQALFVIVTKCIYQNIYIIIKSISKRIGVNMKHTNTITYSNKMFIANGNNNNNSITLCNTNNNTRNNSNHNCITYCCKSKSNLKYNT